MQSVTSWHSTLSSLAATGRLEQSIEEVFGTSVNQLALTAYIDQLASGDLSGLPTIQIVSSTILTDKLGAFGKSTQTIYLNEEVASHDALTLEVLMHEFGHYIASSFYAGNEQSCDAADLTCKLIGADHSLLFSEAGGAHDQLTGTLLFPGSQESISVQWFDTKLHNAWVKQYLPMLNEQGYALLEQAENETDAFNFSSAYGLQTQSASHFDNNNVRGGMEAIIKRWRDGLAQFNSESINARPVSPTETVDRDYVAPDFSGSSAGVQNLLYRFGQITHALQDFYSHSNWVELSQVDNHKWLGANQILDSGLGLPMPLNPGTYLQGADKVMVAMAGPNYAQMLNKVGVGSYLGSSSAVYWWTVVDQLGWGEAYGTPLAGYEHADQIVAGLMTGAVNGVIYHDTDYSVFLRARDRTGFFDQEYFRGFSHGGYAGTMVGQWVSPLAKDSENNGRFSSETANAELFAQAKNFARLQLQNDWDRMGNLIYENYGIEGLQKFADYAVVQSDRDLYVQTYSKSGGRWDWGSIGALPAPALLQLSAADADTHSDVLPDGISGVRTVELFYESSDSDFTSTDNRTYLTQYEQDGQWIDSAAGAVGIHHQFDDDVFVAALTSHVSEGGRALWLENYLGSYLATAYYVEAANARARVYINNFDIDMDIVQIVDQMGEVIDTFDLDRADFEEVSRTLLAKYNVMVNARPEEQLLDDVMVLSTEQRSRSGPALLQAADFFGDANASLGNGDMSGYKDLRFVSQDEAYAWLGLNADGQLEIADLSAVPQGVYEVYVSVTDGASLLEGQRIVLAIDPEVTVGERAYSAGSLMDVSCRIDSGAAFTLWGQVVDDAGQAVGSLSQLATFVGDQSGTPVGVAADLQTACLGAAFNDGTMRFYAEVQDGSGLVALSVRETGIDQFLLSSGDLDYADLTIRDEGSQGVQITEFFLPSTQDLMLGIGLAATVIASGSEAGSAGYRVTMNASLAREASFDGEFGLLLADLKTGYLVDVATGVLLEGVAVDALTVGDYAVYTGHVANGATTQDTVSFILDPDLNLANLALFPYYKAYSPTGTELFLSGKYGTSDSVSHIAKVSQNSVGFEDMVHGDYDFDDLMVSFSDLQVVSFVA